MQKSLLKIGYEPGVTLSKWLKRFDEKLIQATPEIINLVINSGPDALQNQNVDICFIRNPNKSLLEQNYHLIKLYEETPYVLMSKDNSLHAEKHLLPENLAEETIISSPLNMPKWPKTNSTSEINNLSLEQKIDLIAAGVGIIILPQSICRIIKNKELTSVKLPSLPKTSIYLVWPKNTTEQLLPVVEYWVGLVRGRGERSSRSGEIATKVSKLDDGKPRIRPNNSKKNGAAKHAPKRKKPKLPKAIGR